MKMQRQSEKKLVLLLGATGRSGYHIADRLLESKEYPVRVVVRSKAKLQQLFKQKQLAFESIIQGDASSLQTLDKAFKKSQYYGQVKLVINALGASGSLKQKQVQKIQYQTIKNLVSLSFFYKIERFIHISAALMQRPWNPIAVLISTMVPNVYHYKTQAQNYIRQSGLNYTIVRPPELRGSKQHQTPTGYNIDQGDKILGYISRRTLSQIVLHTINTDEIPSQVTFECQANITKNKCQPQNFSLLKADTQKSIVNANHKLSRRTYLTTLFMTLVGAGYLMYGKFIKIQN